MTRVQSGDLKVAKEPHALEEIVGSAVRRLRHVLKEHVVQPDLASDLPLVPLDALLIEQVLVNLLENAARYTPKGRAHRRPRSDTMPARPRSKWRTRGRAFRRSARARASSGSTGRRAAAALASPSVQAIVVAHGGRMWAANRAEGGAILRFALPLASPAASLSRPTLEAHGAL
jgi:two-component system sensor histidine kinase KdpD